MPLDILIKNAMIVDGTSREGFSGDIGIVGDTIQSVGNLSGESAREVVYAQGHLVCPGFIDVHSHSDFSCLVLATSDSKVLQGVTTEVIGNCGLSSAPVLDACKEHLSDTYANLGINLDWVDLRQYAARVEAQGVSVNIVPLIGHGNIRASIMGYTDRNPSSEELQEMKELLRAMMRQGACGMSTGLIYPPGIFSKTEELVELGKVLREFGGIYASHMRSEGDRLLESIEEALAIGRGAGIGVQISHLKTAGNRNWHKLKDALALIENARKEGVDVTVDRYPYTAASTDLDSIFPQWAFVGGNEKEIERLKDAPTLARIRQEVLESHPNPDYWDKVMIASIETDANRRFEGQTIRQLADAKGQEPFEALVALLLAERLKVQAIFFSMSEDNLKEILRRPYTMIGSDASSRAVSGLLSSGKPHPRSYGTFPRVLAKYVKEYKLLSLSEAIHKMTFLPAQKFGLTGRGNIAVGKKADLVILDMDRLDDPASFQDPHRYPQGIEWVLVNGHIVVRKGKHTHATPGKVLLRSN